MFSRRSALKTGLLGVVALGLPHAIVVRAANNTALPNTSDFQLGDLLWPKKPGSYVPYHAGATSSPINEKSTWTSERDAFLRSIFGSGGEKLTKRFSDIQSMTFSEFYARYVGDQQPGVPEVYSSGSGLYVGHVAIIDIDEKGDAWIIEAIKQKGVVRQKYQSWLKNRPGINVWHSRIKDISRNAQELFVSECLKHIGKSYNFWNFDLNDDSGFYCSKLVWLSAYRSLDIALDENMNPKRSFWFSPKQLLYADMISRLHNPGPYAYL